MEPKMTSETRPGLRDTWQVPDFDRMLWLGRRHPWCVVIPVINEGDRIGSLLDRMADLDIAGRADILIVDGGSTDGSLELEAIQARGVRGLLVKTGPGKLSAQLRCAYAFALDEGYEGIVTIDGNDKDDPEAIPRFIEALQDGVDFVQASRFIEGGVAEGTPHSRDLAIRWIHAPILRMGSGYPWTDTTQGFRAYSSKLLLDPQLAPFREEFATYELLAYMSYRAPRLGYRCLEIGTTRRYPPGEVPTKISGLKGNLAILAILMKAVVGAYNPAPESQEPSGSRTLLPTISIVIASIVVASAAMSLALRLDVAQKYPDFIAGYIAGEGSSKFQDLIAAPVFIVAGLFAFWLFSHTMQKLAARAGTGQADEFAGQLVLWSIPAAGALGGLIFATLFDMQVLVACAAGVVLVTVSCLLGLRANSPVGPSMVGLALLACVLLAFIPIELVVVLNRALALTVAPEAFVLAAKIVGGAALALFAAATIWAPRTLQRWLPGLLALAQLGLPAFYFTLRPSPLMTPNGRITAYNTTVWLTVLTAGLFGLGLADVLRRFWKGRNGKVALKLLLSPLALFALLVAYRVGATAIPHVPADDYHFGEQLLGAAYGPGATHFVDYIPPHGMLDDLPALISRIFYDGTAGSVTEATRITFALLALSAFVSIWLFTGSVGLAAFAVLFTGGTYNWPFLVGFLCLWFNPALRKRPAEWLIVWGVTAPIAILGAPGQGLVLVAASGVLAVRSVWDLWTDPRRRHWIRLAVVVVLMLALLAFSPLGVMLWGAIRYVRENGSINQIAYGRVWGVDWPGTVSSGLPLELVRMSWIAIPITCAGTIYFGLRRRVSGVALPAAVVLLFSLLMIPYSMGRVDAGLSRSGILAIFGWSMLIPLVGWRLVKPSARPALLLMIALLAGAFNYTTVAFRVFTPSIVPTTPIHPTIDGADFGLDRMGRLAVDDMQLDRLKRLSQLMANHLKPDETYLDLSNRSANYFYLDRRPPVPIPAVYNMASIPDQQRSVALLRRDPPPLVLMEADNIVHDGVAHSLRAPVLYRYIADTYVPAWEKNFVVGFPKETVDLTVPEAVNIPIKNVTDPAWEAGVSRGEPGIQVADLFPIQGISVGSEVKLSNGQPRRITRIEPGQRAVWLDGGAIGVDEVGALPEFELTVEPGPGAFFFRAALMEKAFGPFDLGKLPVAWGRSESSLAEKMDPVLDLPGPKSPAGALARFDISNDQPRGRDAGLLRFDFECIDRKLDPRIVVGWSGTSGEEADVQGDLRFTGDDGALIVPLYGYPRWSLLDGVREITISLEDPAACGSFRVKDAGLAQPDFFQPT